MATLRSPGTPRLQPVIPAASEARRARDQLMDKIGKDGNLPAIGALILRVVQIASSDGEAVHNLTTFVLSDVALTQKILRIANTVGFRPAAGKQITSISKAIFVLGFETIKTIALALLLVDGMAGKRGEAVRAELMRALAASAVARELAQRSPYRDNEEAAVAALFKNIAQVLVASYDHGAYQRVQAAMAAGRTEAQASMQVIGCSYDMLSEAVLREWKIPETIISGLHEPAAGQLKQPRSRQEWMQQAAACADSAAALVLTPPPRGDRSAYRTLLTRYGAALQVDMEMLVDLMAAASRETHILSSGADLEELTEHIKNRQAAKVGNAVDDDEDEEQEEPADVNGLPADLIMDVRGDDEIVSDERYPSGKPVNARELLLAGVQDVIDMMATPHFRLNDLIMLVLETLYHGMGFRFATICLKDAKTGQFRARISVGEQQEPRQLGFVFPAASAQRDLFMLAMENDADLFISDARDAKIVSLLPTWHKALLPDARSFLVLPLIVRGKPVGFFYADRKRPADEGVPKDETALIKTLKGQVLVALNSHAG